jgi:hypothetical protein
MKRVHLKKIMLGLTFCFRALSASETELEKEIQKLEVQLEKYRLKEMNAEVSGQPLMFKQDHAFSEKMKEAENDELEKEKIEKRLRELKQKLPLGSDEPF